jgi:NADH-quinone oxidoreductase subunit K
MGAVPLDHFLVLAMVMFLIGTIGVLVRRNLIVVMMSVELLLNAASLIFVAGSRSVGNLDGQIMTIFIITVAACEAAIGLAMVIAIYRRYGTVDTGFLRTLRG